jgi:disulfide bond formation protein DsbB/mono/diheme cytochrome c family protein
METQQKDTPETEDETDDIVPTDNVFNLIGSVSRYVALLAAWVATCGSLYMSEALGWTPCLFCWYQRILMYPISLLLALGLLKRDRGVNKYVLLLSIPGICMSAYHYVYQKSELVRGFAPCTVGVPCSADYLNWFNGVVTIPFLALIAFLIITFSMVASRFSDSETDETVELRPAPSRSERMKTILPVLTIIGIVVAAFLSAGISVRSASANSTTVNARATAIAPPTPDSLVTARGKVLFDESCAACHGLRGEGTASGRPLTDSSLVKTGSQAELLEFIRLGRTANDPHNTTGQAMPAGGGRADASDQDVTAIIAYIRSLAGSQ